MESIIEKLNKSSQPFTPAAMDYFGFRRHLWIDELTLKSNTIPPFIVNAPAWDTFLCTDAFRAGAVVLDGSQVITALHQSIDLKHLTLFDSHHKPAMRALVQRNRELYFNAMDYVSTAFCQSDCSHLTLKWGKSTNSIAVIENDIPLGMRVSGCSCCPHALPFTLPDSLTLDLESN